MPRGYSRDLRQRLLHAVTSGVPLGEVAGTTGVSPRSLQRWHRQVETGVFLDLGRASRRPPAIGPELEPHLQAQVSAHPDATVTEHWVASDHPPVSVSTMCRTLARLGLTRKNKRLIASERDLNARAAWQTAIADVAPETLVFLAETSTQSVMTRRYGCAPGGARVVGTVPRNHGPNVTCLVAISAAGVHAPCVFEGALNGVLFVRWVREWLVPSLRPGMTVVLDNLSVNKHAEVHTAIEAADCQLPFCRPTPRTSIRSSSRLQSSRRTCARWRPAPSIRWPTRLASD